jgi:hypothetical protein
MPHLAPGGTRSDAGTRDMLGRLGPAAYASGTLGRPHVVNAQNRPWALLGDQEVYAEAGDLVFKPRGQWHTF